jgi:hypothetical protein
MGDAGPWSSSAPQGQGPLRDPRRTLEAIHVEKPERSQAADEVARRRGYEGAASFAGALWLGATLDWLMTCRP